MIKQLAIAAITAAALLSSSTAFSETLILAALTAWPPFSDENLQANGFSNDLIVQAMKRAGHDVKVSMVPWARALLMANNGEADLVSSMWKTAERETDYLFSDPYYVNRVVFAKRTGDVFEFKTLADLKGKTVGTIRDYSYDAAFLAATDFKREAVGNNTLNFRKLIEGRIDAMPEDEGVLKYELSKVDAKDREKIALTNGALSESTLHMVVPRKRANAEKLIQDFNRGQEEIKRDGTYDKILAAHNLK